MRRDNIIRLFLFILIFILAMGIIMTGIGIAKKARNAGLNIPTETEATNYLVKTRTLDNQTYRLYSGYRFILLLGIDKAGYAQEESTYLTGGQADAVFVMALNEQGRTVNILQIDRDTICSVQTYGILGDALERRDEQIALAYAYGNGGVSSAENMMDAVSRLLGIEIDDYIALNMDGTKYLSSLCGDVTVTLDSDSEWLADGLKAGMEVTITPDNAETFLRARMGTTEGTNKARMARHRLYLDALFAKLKTENHDLSESFLDEWDNLSDYLNTSLSKEEMNAFLTIWNTFEISDIQSPAGTTDYSGEYVRFIIDKESLNELMIAFCFVKK